MNAVSIINVDGLDYGLTGASIPINPDNTDAFKNGTIWCEEDDTYYNIYIKIDKNYLLNQIVKSDYYLKFSSDDSFTLSVSNPQWDGTIEYSLDKGNTWNTWDGSQLSGNENNHIRLRGIGNTKIAGYINDWRWSFTGKYVTGNIETLLDYKTVINGQHPTMDDYCFSYMFSQCTSLITAPQLPSFIVTTGCYRYMFCDCVSLVNIPELPSTFLKSECYFGMFYGCSSLKVSETQTDECQYPYRIPKDISEFVGDASFSRDNMFTNTGGTFTGSPELNTVYYINYQPV